MATPSSSPKAADESSVTSQAQAEALAKRQADDLANAAAAEAQRAERERLAAHDAALARAQEAEAEAAAAAEERDAAAQRARDALDRAAQARAATEAAAAPTGPPILLQPVVRPLLISVPPCFIMKPWLCCNSTPRRSLSTTSAITSPRFWTSTPATSIGGVISSC